MKKKNVFVKIEFVRFVLHISVNNRGEIEIAVNTTLPAHLQIESKKEFSYIQQGG